MKLHEVLVINLDGETARMNAFSDSARKAGLDFRRWPAVNGELLGESYIRSVTSRACERGITCTKGLIGCYLSHLHIWEYIANRHSGHSDLHESWYLICEDDALPTAKFVENVHDIVYADLSHWQSRHAFPQFICLSPLIMPWKVRRASRRLWHMSVVPNMSAYLISARGATALLSVMNHPIYTHVDITLTIMNASCFNCLPIYASTSYITNNDTYRSAISSSTYPRLLADCLSSISSWITGQPTPHIHIVWDSMLFRTFGVSWNVTLFVYAFALWCIRRNRMSWLVGLVIIELVYALGKRAVATMQ